MNYNCPICNQAGLPNYKTQPVQCPQCNADLKPYSLLFSISKTQSRNEANRLIIIVLSILCIVFLFLLSKNSADYKRNLFESREKIQQLRDSLNQYSHGSLYKQIEAANEFQRPFSSRSGQLLNIKLIQN